MCIVCLLWCGAQLTRGSNARFKAVLTHFLSHGLSSSAAAAAALPLWFISLYYLFTLHQRVGWGGGDATKMHFIPLCPSALLRAHLLIFMVNENLTLYCCHQHSLSLARFFALLCVSSCLFVSLVDIISTTLYISHSPLNQLCMCIVIAFYYIVLRAHDLYI